MLPASVIWGCSWEGHQVIAHCDNQGVVGYLKSRTSRHIHLMYLLRSLAFTEARHSFCLRPKYINTRQNHIADNLFHNSLSSLLSKVPQAQPYPSPLPPRLAALLLDPTADWLTGAFCSLIFPGRPSPLLTRRSYAAALKRFHIHFLCSVQYCNSIPCHCYVVLLHG